MGKKIQISRGSYVCSINENRESQIGSEVNAGSLRPIQVQLKLPAD